jgi:hypothetical protein
MYMPTDVGQDRSCIARQIRDIGAWATRRSGISSRDQGIPFHPSRTKTQKPTHNLLDIHSVSSRNVPRIVSLMIFVA